MARVYKRDGTYWIDFNDSDGRRRRISTKTRVKQIANDILADKLAKVAKKEHLGVIDDTAMSFAAFADLWISRVEANLRPRTRGHWRQIVEIHLKPEFPIALRAINLGQVEDYVARRVAHGAKPSTVNNTLSVLRHIFRRAVEWELLGSNPLTKLKLLNEPDGRVRFLSPQEIDQLLTSFPTEKDSSPLVRTYLKPLVLLGINSGMRLSEMLGLQRRDIDWANATTQVEGKGGKVRQIRLNEAALEALRSLPPRVDSPLLFPFNRNQASMAFSRVAKRAGIEDFHFHDLRHSFASYQAMAGLSPRALQDLLGHRDQRMTMRYSHLSDDFLRAAVDRVQVRAPSSDA